MRSLIAAVALVLVSSPALAQEAGAPKGDDGKKDAGKDGKDGKAAKEVEDHGELDIEGRVFVRSTLSRADIPATSNEPWLHDLSLASARLTADYRLKKRLQVVVEAELADNDLDLKDVFIRARLRKNLHLLAGQFKKPISPIALESGWRLPLVERGLLGDLDSASTAPLSSVPLPFGGRGIGAAIEAEIAAPLPIQLIVAAFEHSIIDADINLIDVSEALPVDPFVRAVVEPVNEMRFGATVALITHRNRLSDSSPQDIDHAPLASVDAEVEQGPVKFWLEGYVGGSTVWGDDDRADGLMAAARGLVAVRIDRVATWLQRVEPFVTGSWVDPVLDDDGDHGLQGATGAALSFHERLRLQVELEITRMSDDPTRLRQLPRWVLYTQLGAVF